jgi:hypothetical protein
VAGLLGIDVWDDDRGELVSLPNRVAKKLLEEDEEIRELAKRHVAQRVISRLALRIRTWHDGCCQAESASSGVSSGSGAADVDSAPHDTRIAKVSSQK